MSSIVATHGFRLTAVGKALEPFIERHPLSELPALFEAVQQRTDPRSIHAGALGAALWGAFRHGVLARRSAA